MAEPNVELDCHEQEQWTKICEMYTYLSRVDDMDEEQWKMLKALSDGFVELMNVDTKKTVLDYLHNLLSAYVDRDQNYNIENDY